MSHDRGCPCGREKFEYADCRLRDCDKRSEVAAYVNSIIETVERKPKVAKSVLARADLFWLGDLLRKHCAVVNGFAVYEEGWDDERLFKEMREAGRPCSMINVTNLRVELIGNIRKLSNQTANGVSPDEIRVINDKLDTLHEENDELRRLMKEMRDNNEHLENVLTQQGLRLKRLEDWGRTRPHVPYNNGGGGAAGRPADFADGKTG